MRFPPGQLIGFGTYIHSGEPVYIVRHYTENYIFAIDLADCKEHHFDISNPNHNTGCLYDYGTFAEVMEKLK